MSGLEKVFRENPAPGKFAQYYLSYLSDLLARLDVDVIERIIDLFVEASERGNTIYFIGNGGSAATASHFAADIAINTRAPGAKPFRTISLADNVATITALANDESYSNIFVSQLENVLKRGDLVMGLSVSGNSTNVVEAVRYAKKVGAVTVGLTGFGGGALAKIADVNLHVPTLEGEYGPVEDVFQVLDHLMYSFLRLKRFGRLAH